MNPSDQLIRRVITGFGVFYLVFLLGAVAITSFKFRDYYVPPALDPTLGEDAVLQLWDLNYEHRYREYKRFILPIGLSLALFLPIWAAALGVWIAAQCLRSCFFFGAERALPFLFKELAQLLAQCSGTPGVAFLIALPLGFIFAFLLLPSC